MTDTDLQSPNVKPKRYAALEHYDYGVLDRYCLCEICEEWRKAEMDYAAAGFKAKDHHPEHSGCRCDTCQAYFKSRSRFLATTNRRTLYSEMSYHSTPHLTGNKPFGSTLMEWVTGVVRDRLQRNDSWWENRAAELPMKFWFKSYNNTRVLAASGTCMVPLR